MNKRSYRTKMLLELWEAGPWFFGLAKASFGLNILLLEWGTVSQGVKPRSPTHVLLRDFFGVYERRVMKRTNHQRPTSTHHI